MSAIKNLLKLTGLKGEIIMSLKTMKSSHLNSW